MTPPPPLGRHWFISAFCILKSSLNSMLKPVLSLTCGRSPGRLSELRKPSCIHGTKLLHPKASLATFAALIQSRIFPCIVSTLFPGSGDCNTERIVATPSAPYFNTGSAQFSSSMPPIANTTGLICPFIA